MLREGREVRSRTDYILGTERRLFGNASIRYPRHSSDHYLVLGCLYSASLKEHTRYLGGRKNPPPPPTTNSDNEGEKCFRSPTEGSPETAGAGGL